MDKELIIEALKAAESINETLEEQLQSEKYGMEPWIWLEVQVGSEGVVVMFLGECLWNSENDERELVKGETISAGVLNKNEVTFEHYQPLEPYLRTKIMKLIANLQKIQL